MTTMPKRGTKISYRAVYRFDEGLPTDRGGVITARSPLTAMIHARGPFSAVAGERAQTCTVQIVYVDPITANRSVLHTFTTREDLEAAIAERFGVQREQRGPAVHPTLTAPAPAAPVVELHAGDRVACRGDLAYPGTVALVDADGLALLFTDRGHLWWARSEILAPIGD